MVHLHMQVALSVLFVSGFRQARRHSLEKPGITKNIYPSNWPFLGHCVRPHGEGGLYDDSVRKCANNEGPPPFTKESRIAIIGGGPAGVSMARLLWDRGFTKITLYEKSNRLGGKSKNFDYKGEQHDLGTCYMVGKYECIEAWVEDLGLTENVITVDRLITSDTTPIETADHLPSMKMLTVPNYAGSDWWMAMKTYGLQTKVTDVGLWIKSFPGTFKDTVKRYIGEWTKTMRSTEYMFPTNPDFTALNQTYFSWLKERDLTAIVPKLHVSTGGQGYGRLDSTPAIYGLMWNHPNLLSGAGQHSMIKEGFQSLWDHLLDSTNVDIRFGQEIVGIVREPVVSVETKRETEDYDFLVMAAPMPDALAMLDYTQEEKSLFSSYYHHELVLTVLKTEDEGKIVDPDYQLLSWGDNLDAQTDISLRVYDDKTNTASSTMTDQIDGKDGPLTIRQTRNIKNLKQDNVIGTLQVSNTATSDEQLKNLVLDSLSDFDITATVLHQERWPNYMPQFNLKQVVEERKPWKIWDLQGQTKTWFTGSYASFESVADVLDYNIQLVNTHLCSGGGSPDEFVSE